MSSRTELVLAAYFRLLALSCSAPRRAVQGLLSGYLALVLGDMLVQFWRYFGNGWQMNDFQLCQFSAYVRIIDAMNVAYLVAHMLMVLQALVWRNRERRLLAQLPALGPAGTGTGTGTQVRLHLALECTVGGTALTLAIIQSIHSRQLLPNLRYLFSTQAVRARYLQMALLVVRLDAQLVALLQQLATGRRSTLELRASYAHIVRLARHLSRLYGLSVLMMNVLCIGDFIMVCYVCIILYQLTSVNLSWLLLWQTVYVVLPTVIKIWSLSAVCHSCAQRSQQLLELISGSWRRQDNTGTRNSLRPNQNDEFTLQIMQNAIQFDVCGIYHLNLKTMAGMFIFILDTMVIFLQFVELTKQQTS